MRCVGRTATASVHISSVWRAYSQRVELGDSVSLSRTAEIGAQAPSDKQQGVVLHAPFLPLADASWQRANSRLIASF